MYLRNRWGPASQIHRDVGRTDRPALPPRPPIGRAGPSGDAGRPRSRGGHRRRGVCDVSRTNVSPCGTRSMAIRFANQHPVAPNSIWSLSNDSGGLTARMDGLWQSRLPKSSLDISDVLVRRPNRSYYSVEASLARFGAFYRADVMPAGTDVSVRCTMQLSTTSLLHAQLQGRVRLHPRQQAQRHALRRRDE